MGRLDHKKTKQGGPRSAARLAAAQALYQLAMAERPSSERIVQEYEDHRLGQEIEGDQYVGADFKLFADITKGAWDRHTDWDKLIEENLTTDWSIARIDPVVLGILRCGAYELSQRIDVPTAVVINEYLDITHAFYDGSEVSFVNGILDGLGKKLR